MVTDRASSTGGCLSKLRSPPIDRNLGWLRTSQPLPAPVGLTTVDRSGTGSLPGPPSRYAHRR